MRLKDLSQSNVIFSCRTCWPVTKADKIMKRTCGGKINVSNVIVWEGTDQIHESEALIVAQCCMLVHLVVKVTSCTTQAPI